MVFMMFSARSREGEGLEASPLRGFAIQCRVSLAPGGNEVSKYEEPAGEGVRVDAALYAGGKPSMHYDPLVGKLICYAEGTGWEAFEACRTRSIEALDRYVIDGVNTNKPTLRGILHHPEFINNEVLLSFMARHGATLAGGSSLPAASSEVKPAALRRQELAVASPLEATVVKSCVAEGAEVEEGQLLVLLSAMKLETEVRAPHAGTVLKVKVAENETVTSGQDLVVPWICERSWKWLRKPWSPLLESV